jgi:sugar phosphate isomerase/epimerase
MLLGGEIRKPYSSPEEWLALVKEMKYKAVYFPVDSSADEQTIDEYAKIARDNNLVIAEIGVWRNVLSPDKKIAKDAMDYAKAQLALAERVGALCCVNISGSRGQPWDGPNSLNFTRETFDLIVDSVREIIDAVKPERTYYTLEPMPWMYPHTADSCLELIKAVDRKAFAAHFDPVNIITNPFDFYRTGDIIKEWFDKLAPYIKSCHGKDVSLESRLTVHINEVRPGLGGLDYAAYIECLKKHPHIPLMTEHMDNHEDVVLADAYVRKFIY